MSDQAQMPIQGTVSRRVFSALLSGMGYYRLSRRRQRILTTVFLCSLAAHAFGLIVFGGYVLFFETKEEPTIFRTPPPTKRYEPRKLEHQVKVQKRQRSSSRPAMLPRLVSMSPSRISLPEIKMDPKLIHTTFQPNFKAVTGKGLGAGLGTGYGTHGFGSGVSAISFFGLRARSDKIMLALDVSTSMVEEIRGGVAGFARVKQRFTEVIDAMPPMAMFNVVVFDVAARVLWPEFRIANDSNKQLAKRFVQPFNVEGSWGLDEGAAGRVSIGLPQEGGTTRLDLALNESIKQGAHTVLLFSDGIPWVRKGITQEQLQAYERERQQWETSNAARIQAWNAAQASAQVVEERVWVPPRPAQPARPAATGPPAREGQAPDRGSPAVPEQPGHWTVVHRHVGGGGGGERPQPPPRPEPTYWTLADFVEHMNILHEKLLKPKGLKMPEIHAIGYIICNDGDAFLRGLTRQFKGQYKRITRLR